MGKGKRIKISDKHSLLYESEKRYVYEKGGRGSGKSTAVTDYALRITYDYGRVILFMRYTMVAASISIIPEFENLMEMHERAQDFQISGSEITNKLTGSKIIFKGVKTSSLNQTANLKSIQGLTDVIYDEFEEHPDQESFDKLDESIRTLSASNRIVLVSNALHKQSWQSKQFLQKEGLYYDMTDRIFTTWRDNEENLSDSWHEKRKLVEQKNPKKYLKDYEGEDYDDVDGALWTTKTITKGVKPSRFKRIAIAIDPAVTSNENSDESGIMIGGIGYDNKGYLLHDATDKYSPNELANKVNYLYEKFECNIVISEVNNGGDFIESVIKNVNKNIPHKSVRASRGKELRAEPIVAKYESGDIIHCGYFPELELEQTTWNPMKSKSSPNRIDAVVWLFTYLLLNLAPPSNITFASPNDRRPKRTLKIR